MRFNAIPEEAIPMATVTRKVKGGKWYAIFTDDQGRQRWKTGYTDKAETQRMANRLEDEAKKVRMGDIDHQAVTRRMERNRPMAEHIESFRQAMVGLGRSSNHIAYTIRDVELCIDHTGITNPNQLTKTQVELWRTHCLTKGYPDWRHPDGPPNRDSRKTVNRRIASVRAWLYHLMDKLAVDRNVLFRMKMLDCEGHQTFKRRALTKAESGLLVDKTPDPHRREIYRFILHTGLRRAETAHMKPSNFNFTNRTITVIASEGKRKGENQIIPMHPALVDPLKELCNGKKSTDRIFDVPRKQVAVAVLHGDCLAAGIDTRDVDFHALRHTYITHLAEAGVRPEVLQKLARHDEIKTTLSYYVHLRPDDEHNAIAML